MTKKLAVVTCQPDPDYVRARVLRASLKGISEVEVHVLKNFYRGIFRYFEVAWKIAQIRWKYNPEIYVLTFRGYEILPWLLLVARGKKVIFDEFINPIEWVALEHKLLNAEGFFCKILDLFYRFLLKRCDAVITDTESHARLSSSLSGISLQKYFPIPVGADETVFFPAFQLDNKISEIFTVFFYGNILPLHGLDVILAAALQLKGYAQIEFLLIGGSPHHFLKIEDAIRSGARIVFKKHVQFEELAHHIRNASVCLGGPFGDTLQAQHVITGKTFQYLACAVPAIIGSNFTNSFFSDKINALVIPQGNPTALSTAIVWGYTHRSLLREIGESGRRLYEKEFSTACISARVSNLLTCLDENSLSHE